MKKFFALLFANILLIHIGIIPQLGRLYAYPIYRFFTGANYDNDWFCNPLIMILLSIPCFIVGLYFIFVKSRVFSLPEHWKESQDGKVIDK